MLLAGPNVSFLLLQQLLLLNILCHELVVAARPNRPHIWTVMVDDLGWNGMSFSGNNDEVQTPVVAQLARSEGVIFESHYVYKFCSPTRASFLTGRFPGHGIQETNLGMTSEVGCNGNLTMIAAKLKQAGYVTLQIGKWHQGFYSAEFTPHGRGFDTSFGFLGGGEDHLSQCHGCENSIPDPDWATEKFSCPASYSPCGVVCPDQGGVDLYCTDKPCIDQNTTANPFLYANEITNAVRAAAADPSGSPRFAFLALHNCHQPVEAPPEFVNLYPSFNYNDTTYARRVYNGMHSGVEYVVANLTAELKASGLWNNSILLFLADNGGTFEHGLPVPGSSNFPLRGHKYSYFEGGVRASSFLASPLLPPAVIGTTNNALLHVADWWPTFAGLAGLNTTDDCGGKHPNGCPSVDGRDAWAIITGETGDQSVSANARTHADRVPWRTELLLGIGGPKQQGAYINASFKYIATGGNTAAADGWSAQYPGDTAFTPPGPDGTPSAGCGVTDECLFDLLADPLERNNLAEHNPQLLAAMRERYKVLAAAAYAPNGNEVVEAELGLPGPNDCGTDQCWLQREREVTLAALQTKNQAKLSSAACVFNGYWIVGEDIFDMRFNASKKTVDLKISNGTCGGCAFANASGTLALDPNGTGNGAIFLVAQGRGEWVAHYGSVANGGCRIEWDHSRCNGTGGMHRWNPFCKADAPIFACRGPLPPPPTPTNAACSAMMSSGYWQPWVTSI
eukprot:INCI4111.6.p1 GENE.INCI4111.6~~INCI4111.6.p1  ORF type:complete len:734 (-),score=97.45 INCI4111.6:2429-4630(-)